MDESVTLWMSFDSNCWPEISLNSGVVFEVRAFNKSGTVTDSGAAAPLAVSTNAAGALPSSSSVSLNAVLSIASACLISESFQFQNLVRSISSLTFVSPRMASPTIPFVGNEMTVVGTLKQFVW